MFSRKNRQLLWGISLMVMLMFVLSACNLGAAPEEEATLTSLAETGTPDPNATRTIQPTGGVTVFPTLTPFVFSTRPVVVPTTIVLVPNQPVYPTVTAAPISIVIVSPLSGNIVSGTVQVVGSASHPNFLQYRLEFGPDPNPNNLWFSLTGVVQQQVLAGTLGVWPTNTGATPDGYYQLRLRVFLRDGTQQTTQVGAIRVQNNQPTPFPTNTTVPAPIAAFRVLEPSTGAAPLVVRFDDRSQGQISSYSWSFGDGGSSNSRNPTYTFRRAGTYTVTLRVTGQGGSSNVSRQIVVSSPSAPVASFTVSPSTSGQAPFAVTFTSTSTGQINSYEWDFGDNTPDSTEQRPSHTFTAVGTYNVILRVTGPGGSSTMIQQITVVNPSVPPPVAVFEPSDSSIETGQSVTFNNTSTGQINSFLWDFNGDGITDNTNISPTHIYPAAGTYTVRLIAIGPGGQNATTRQVVVANPPNAPTASFTASTETGVAPLTVNFTNTTTGDATSYSWDLDGDGDVDSNQQNASFAYSDAGTYTVTLTATGAGGSTTTSRIITVDSPPEPPTANFTFTPNTGEAPVQIQFTNGSTGNSLSYQWDLDGDGDTDSTDEHPSQNYTNAGSYSVRLTVTDPDGQSDSETQVLTITAPVVAPPVANFSFTPNGGQAPLDVSFTSEATGDISSHTWDFGDGGTSTGVNPDHTFDTGGTYTVTLTVTGAGGSNTTTRTITVDAELQPPVANFSADQSTVVEGDSVQFTSNSSGQVDSYLWDFGDGQTSTDANPSHSFAAAGSYNVSLTVSNAAGASAPFSATITVEAALSAPTASFTADQSTITEGGSVNFTSTSSGQVDSYLWDFGDGQTSTDANPSHSFAAAGSYNVSLTVSNAAGASAPFSATITVEAALSAPTASFTADQTTITEGGSVNFTSTSSGQVDSYLWDFGDGQTSTDANPSHSFAAAGSYNVSLTVSNAAGASAPFSATITVEAALTAPTASFTADQTTITEGGSVNFTSTSSGQVDSYLWDFGDGQTSTDANPSHTFAAAGSYNVSLTVSNAAGASAPFSATITVEAALTAPTASFTADQSTITEGGSVNFTSTSSGQVDSYLWDFGDGQTSTDANPSHTFAAAGSYNVSLTVSNTAGASAPFSATITVEAALTAPTASFTADQSTITEGGSVNFTSTSSGQVDSYLWDFGDGQTSTDANPSHSFAAAGSYNVSLTVSNTAGASAPFSATITVEAALSAPTASFTADQSTITEGGSVNFTSTSSGQVDSYLWDFGDGQTSTDANPSHTFAAAGSYNVSLTVSNTAGASAPFSATITVEASTPTVNITGEFAFVRDGEIFVVNADGSNEVNVTNNGADDTDPAWSPDGSKLAFSSNRQGDYDLYVLNISDGAITQISFDTSDDAEPSWSPDGARIAYTRTSGGNSDIYLLNVGDNSVSPWLATPANESYAAWSPDGSQIAYQSNTTGNDEIFVANLNDTNTAVNISNDAANDRFPSWSVDNQIAFSSNRDGDNEIYSMNPDGSNVLKLTDNNANDRFPHWTPNGNRLVYTSNLATDGGGGESNQNIYTMRADGSEQAPYTTGGADETRGVRR